MDEGPCMVCDKITTEGKFETEFIDDFGSEIAHGFCHNKCWGLSALSMEAKARRRLEANPNGRAEQIMMRVFENMADRALEK